MNEPEDQTSNAKWPKDSDGDPPARVEKDGWKYFGTNSGRKAAKILTDNRADPATVWAHRQGLNRFHVWYKNANSPRLMTFTYKHNAWKKSTPHASDVYRRSATVVPLGFGGRGGRPVQLYFEVTRPAG